MYKIYADGELIHSLNMAESGNICISPVINLQVNTHGSMTFIMPPEHPHYDEIQARTTKITAYDDSEKLFAGRVIECTIDFYGQKQVYAEGEMSYLCDSVFRPFGFKGSISAFLQMALDSHNSQVDSSRQIQLGSVTVTDSNDTIVRSSIIPMTTWELIETRLLENNGGYVRVREDGGTLYLDYLADFVDVSDQEIRFGENLLDIENYVTASDVITCLIPYGAEYTEDEEEYEPQPENGFYSGNRVTVESVNGGKDYIESETGIAIYGRVWGSNIWEDVTLPENLLPKAQDYLEDYIAAATTLTITAIDLHNADVDVQRIHLGEYVRTYSQPHDLNMTLLCYSQKLDLSNPDQSEITLGGTMAAMSDMLAGITTELNTNATATQDDLLWLWEVDY